MKEIVIFTEEPSIKPVFDNLAQRLDLCGAYLRIVPHNGVSDLEKSLPRKLRAWQNPNSVFLVVRDNDHGDCIQRKAHLQTIVDSSGKGDRTLIRIVCQELEAWFLGDRQAMDDAGILNITDNPASLRGDPDQLHNPSQLLDRHLNGYMKVRNAETIAPFMCPDRNISASFRQTVQAIKRLAEG